VSLHQYATPATNKTNNNSQTNGDFRFFGLSFAGSFFTGSSSTDSSFTGSSFSRTGGVVSTFTSATISTFFKAGKPAMNFPLPSLASFGVLSTSGFSGPAAARSASLFNDSNAAFAHDCNFCPSAVHTPSSTSGSFAPFNTSGFAAHTLVKAGFPDKASMMERNCPDGPASPTTHTFSRPLSVASESPIEITQFSNKPAGTFEKTFL